MIRSHVLALLAVGFVLLPGAAHAAQEDAGAHTKHPIRVIILDNEDIKPSTMTLAKGDVLEFENHSLHPMQVTFTEPANLQEKIRCGLIRPNEAKAADAPWQLFSWKDGKLTGTIPPGRFASVCSFQEGTYSYVVARQGVALRGEGSGGDLPEKGEVVVK